MLIIVFSTCLWKRLRMFLSEFVSCPLVVVQGEQEHLRNRTAQRTRQRSIPSPRRTLSHCIPTSQKISWQSDPIAAQDKPENRKIWFKIFDKLNIFKTGFQQILVNRGGVLSHIETSSSLYIWRQIRPRQISGCFVGE